MKCYNYLKIESKRHIITYLFFKFLEKQKKFIFFFKKRYIHYIYNANMCFYFRIKNSTFHTHIRINIQYINLLIGDIFLL